MSKDFNFAMEAKTSEEHEIADAIEKHKGIRWWEKRLGITSWVFYGVAAALWIIRGSSEGMGLIWLMVLALFVTVIIIGYFESRARFVVVRLVNAYKRKNTVPLYHEMLEKFADHPNLHIHLADDGTIVIRDKKKETKS